MLKKSVIRKSKNRQVIYDNPNRDKPKERWTRNKSKTTPDGVVLKTRDAFLPHFGSGESPHEKEHPEKGNPGLYRMVLVVDSNRKNELAILEMESNKTKFKKINKDPNDRGRVSRTIHTTFRDGSPLKRQDVKLAHYDIPKDYSSKEAKAIRTYITDDKEIGLSMAKDNRRKLKILKKRGQRK